MKIKWAVLGSGGIACRRTIPEGILPARNASLTAVYDINKTINKEVSEQYGAYAADSIDELLGCDVDAVYIATPANMHCEQVEACVRAKKHVLCEKPLGLTVNDACQMSDICSRAGVMLGSAFMMQFHSQHKAALKMIRDGCIGKPIYARAQLSCWYPPIEGAWRQNPDLSGGGSLMDMGGHCIDLLEMFFGKIKKVSCFVNNTIHNYKSEDSAAVMLFFENGAIGVVDTFFCIPDICSENRLELYGSHGSIFGKGTIGQSQAGEMTAFLQQEAADYSAEQKRCQLRGIKIDPPPVNMYRAEIEEFSQSIIELREPANNAKLGIQSQIVIAACYESAKTGKVVDIN